MSRRKRQRKQTCGWIWEVRRRRLEIDEDEADLLLYLLEAYEREHRLCGHLRQLLIDFADSALHIHEIEAQQRATAHWEEPQNTQDRRLRSLRQKAAGKAAAARAKLEAKEIRRQLRKAAKAKSAELRRQKIEEYREQRAAKLAAEANGHGVGVVVKDIGTGKRKQGKAGSASVQVDAAVPQEHVVEQLGQPLLAHPEQLGGPAPAVGGNELQDLPVEEGHGGAIGGGQS